MCNASDGATNKDGHSTQPIMENMQSSNKNPYKNNYFIIEVFLFICYFLNATNNKITHDISSFKNWNDKLEDKYVYVTRMLASVNPIVLSYYAINVIIDND